MKVTSFMLCLSVADVMQLSTLFYTPKVEQPAVNVQLPSAKVPTSPM